MELTLIGRLRGEHVDEVRALVREANREELAVVLDLREVQFVDRLAVEFLAACERDGVELRNCSPYIRDWVTRVASRKPSRSNGEEVP